MGIQIVRGLLCRLALAALWLPMYAHAETPQQILGSYEAQAREQSSGFAGSADRGRQFFATRHGRDWSCSSCHTEDPTVVGKHVVTGKPIRPMAVSANPERFSRAEKVEKWFGRNCKDVVGRACSPAEKADVVAYLMNAK